MIARSQHSIVKALSKLNRAWSDSPEQADARALITAKFLVESGYFPDAEIWHGLVVFKEEKLVQHLQSEQLVAAEQERSSPTKVVR